MEIVGWIGGAAVVEEVEATRDAAMPPIVPAAPLGVGVIMEEAPPGGGNTELVVPEDTFRCPPADEGVEEDAKGEGLGELAKGEGPLTGLDTELALLLLLE